MTQHDHDQRVVTKQLQRYAALYNLLREAKLID